MASWGCGPSRAPFSVPSLPGADNADLLSWLVPSSDQLSPRGARPESPHGTEGAPIRQEITRVSGAPCRGPGAATTVSIFSISQTVHRRWPWAGSPWGPSARDPLWSPPDPSWHLVPESRLDGAGNCGPCCQPQRRVPGYGGSSGRICDPAQPGRSEATGARGQPSPPCLHPLPHTLPEHPPRSGRGGCDRPRGLGAQELCDCGSGVRPQTRAVQLGPWHVGGQGAGPPARGRAVASRGRWDPGGRAPPAAARGLLGGTLVGGTAQAPGRTWWLDAAL